jgi:hypothetical protein
LQKTFYGSKLKNRTLKAVLFGSRKRKRANFYSSTSSISLVNHFILNLIDILSEWRQSQSCQFEVLHAERYSDNRDAEESAEDKMRQTNPDASDANPDYIHDDIKATATAAVVCDSRSKRPQGDYRKL